MTGLRFLISEKDASLRSASDSAFASLREITPALPITDHRSLIIEYKVDSADISGFALNAWLTMTRRRSYIEGKMPRNTRHLFEMTA